MHAITGLNSEASIPAISSPDTRGNLYQPSSVVDGPRVTVTGHRTDSFHGFDGVMFQAMFETPFGAGLRPDGNHDQEQPIGPDDPVIPLPVDAEFIVQTSEFFHALPAEAQQALMSSPTLVHQLATFLISGGSIRFEDLGNGAAGSFQPATADEGALIRIHDGIFESLNRGELYRLERFLGSVAHELGHAMTSMGGFELDVSSRQSYIESGLMNEAYAVLNVMLVMHEVTEAGNVDVLPMMVFTGGNANQSYESLYAQFAADSDLGALLTGVAGHLRTLPGDPYGEFYGADWDNRFG